MRKRIIATLIALTLIVGGSVMTAVPANATPGNKIQNSSNRCTIFTWHSNTRRITICGLNNSAPNVRHVIVPKGTCLEMGFWTFTRYCASGVSDRLVPVGSGIHYVR